MIETEVLVVGAGPVGLTLAAELAKRGVHSRIIDQSVGPSTTSKAIAIQPRTLEVFQHMGLVDEVLARGVVVGAGNFYLNGRPLARVDFKRIDSPYSCIVDLPQNETEEVLLEHLARNGVEVERDTRLLQLNQDEQAVFSVVAHAGGSETIQSCYVVGCDGAHSTVRHMLGLKSVSSPRLELLILADVAVDWLYPHELHMFTHAEGFLVCFPLSAGRYRLIADVTQQEPAAASGKSDTPPKATPERFREIIRRRADADANIGDVTWLAGFRVQRQVVEEYGRGRVFVAGDAAHVPSPAGGQGMNTGIQDACNLAWKLHLAIRGQAADGLLASYSAERAPVGRDMMALSDRMREAAESDVSSLVDQISEIGIQYRESPIVAQDWQGEDGPHPGDRAPVIAGLDGSAHHLLLFTGDDADMSRLATVRNLMPKGLVYPSLITTRRFLKDRAAQWGDAVILDEDRRIHQRFGADPSCVYLVRPDGYVGYRGRPGEPEQIAAYLQTVFK